MFEALPDLLLRHRHARAIAIACNVALAALLLLVVAKFLWLLAGAGTPDVALRTAAVAPAPVAPAESLARWHLFGNPAPLPDPRGVAGSAPDTTLQLTLRGIFSQSDPQAGRAIIVDANGREASYAVGAEIPGGATLHSVHQDRVTLSRGGALETLRLPRPEDRAPGTPATAAASAPQPRGTPAPANQQAQQAPAPFATAPVVLPNTIDWNAATAKLGVDTEQLARQVQVLPVIENGSFVGVRLSGGQSNVALAKLGLKPDDVVTQVNGIPLDNISRAQAVADSLANASSIAVTVRRGGELEEISVNLQ